VINLQDLLRTQSPEKEFAQSLWLNKLFGLLVIFMNSTMPYYVPFKILNYNGRHGTFPKTV
jgi:hypothetical protein